MKVFVETRPTDQRPYDSSCDKQADLAKPGNRKWLVSHILWAARNGQQVTIRPSL